MIFKKDNIPYKSARSFSRLVLDYILDEPKLKEFYQYRPDLPSFAKAINDRASFLVDRNLLHHVISRQYLNFSVSSITKNNIDLLKENNCFTVTTGHQLCLFTGPLYFLYKIITTINLAKELKKKFPDNHFVPVYWMVSEDHDFEEINHANIFGNKITWNINVSGPAGRVLTSTFQPVLDELSIILGNNKNGEEIHELMQSAYLGQPNLSKATRHLINHFFGDDGLVIIDPDEKEFKKIIGNILLDDMLNHVNHLKVSNTVTRLNSLGYHAQVSPRKINVFYIMDNLRSRVILKEGNYIVKSTDVHFDKSELEEQLLEHPEMFGPNVVTRPLYQEMLLPNIAYIGGPAEIAYWLEYKEMFEHHKIFYPVIVLRNSAMIINKTYYQRMQSLNLMTQDIFQDTEKLISDFITNKAKDEVNLDEEIELMNNAYKMISSKASVIDKSLEGMIQSEYKKHLKSIQDIQHRLIKVEKNRFAVSLEQIRNLKEKLFPQGKLQERLDNFIPFYLQYGKEFIQQLKEQFYPFQKDFYIFYDG